MIDPHGRHVTYLRVSVTDRCDFRCVYCMSEDMTFLPKSDVLSLEELDRVCSAFVAKGVRKLRLTGGEPLVRRNIMQLVRALGRHLKSGDLDELTLTTNGSLLEKYAAELVDCGVRRINISLDSLNPEKFSTITRGADLSAILKGIEAAKRAGLKIKINTVALKNFSEEEFNPLIAWCGEQGFDITFIETMPLGDIGGDRTDQYLPLSDVREMLSNKWTLTDNDTSTGGPSRYVDVAETGQRIGFITPLTHNFCATCNRVRLTCTGKLYMCLGQDDSADLRSPLRASEGDELLFTTIDEAIGRKPKSHEFTIEPGNDAPALARHMNTTGG
ncbi:MAG: GTP 3',8-cyclase MoaA [Rhodospirillaceae bacterium]|nr:GTP 3',8-cyclase MoaA [Rhodospirillaceae bacterium]